MKQPNLFSHHEKPDPDEAWVPAAILPEDKNWGYSDIMFVCQFGPTDLGPTVLLAAYDFSREQWRTSMGQIDNVTHWQPTPRLPKEYCTDD